ncbi:MAG: BatD family protein, partial [bacterium]
MVRLILKISLILMLATAALHGAWSVKSDISSNRIGIDDNLTVTITVSGDKLDNHQQPSLPTTDDWAFAGVNRSTSTNFQLIGGRMSKEITYTYQMILAPTRKGNLTVPQIPISANNETKNTPAYQVEVVEGSVSGRSSPSPRSSPTPSQPDDGDIRDRVFLSATTNKKSATVGEQIVVTYTLYTQYQLANISFSREPSFNGFWADNLYRAKSLNYQRRNIDGQYYSAVVLGKWALFPLTPGDKTIEPMELTATALTQRDFFGFRTGGQNIEIKARPISIDVKPLPSGAPASFNGLVGDFSMVSELKADTLATNQAFSYIVSISGTGNIQNLNAPKLNFPSSFEEYGVQEGSSINTDRDIVSGTKRYEYVLVPRSPGEFELPKVDLTYFDLNTGKYVTKSAGPIPIRIAKGKDIAGGTGSIVSRGEVFRVGQDIRHIASDAKSLKKGSLTQPNGGSILYFLLGEFIFLAVILGIRRRRDKLSSDIGYARYTKAVKRAFKDLRTASTQFGQTEAFVATVQSALLHYLADRLS